MGVCLESAWFAVGRTVFVIPDYFRYNKFRAERRLATLCKAGCCGFGRECGAEHSSAVNAGIGGGGDGG